MLLLSVLQHISSTRNYGVGGACPAPIMFLRTSAIFLLLLSTFGCRSQDTSELDSVDVASDAEEPINQIPMYGYLPKTPAQRASDAALVEEVVQRFGDRRAASNALAQGGWDHAERGDLGTAMSRFNQAWLLDSTSAVVYWGFGTIRGQQGRSAEAVKLLSRAAVLDSTNARLLTDLATAYQDRYTTGRDTADLRLSLSAVDRARALDPAIAAAHARAAFAHYYLREIKAARAAMNEALRLDPRSVPPELIEALQGLPPPPPDPSKG